VLAESDEGVDAAAAVPRAAGGPETGKATRCPEMQCDVDDDDDDDEDDRVDASKNKKWNCYTVFIKEGLADFHLTGVRPG